MNNSILLAFIISLAVFIVVFILIANLHSASVAMGGIIAAIVGAGIFIVCAGYIPINWTAVAAVGTLAAVAWAVWHQEFSQYLIRPILNMSFFQTTSPHLVKQVGASFEKRNSKIVTEEYYGLFVTIELTNSGKTVAKDTQPLLTNVWSKDVKTKKWIERENWIAIPLKWVLPLRSFERDLVPNRPYLFTLGSFSERRDGKLLLTYNISPKGQEETVNPGEHCFEVTVYALGTEPIKNYFYITFEDFSGITELKKTENYIKKVNRASDPP